MNTIKKKEGIDRHTANQNIVGKFRVALLLALGALTSCRGSARRCDELTQGAADMSFAANWNEKLIRAEMTLPLAAASRDGITELRNHTNLLRDAADIDTPNETVLPSPSQTTADTARIRYLTFAEDAALRALKGQRDLAAQSCN